VGSTGDRSWHPRESLLRAKDRSPPGLERFVLKLVREIQRIEPFDRAMTLAAQAFTSIFPLVIATLSLVPRPESTRLRDQLAEALALPESTRSRLEEAFPDLEAQSTTFGLLGVLIVLLSATSFSRALTRMYAKVWSVGGPGWVQGAWRWIAAIVVIAGCSVGLQVAWVAAEGGSLGVPGVMFLALVVNSVLWTWVPSVLLAGRVPWTLLAPAGVLMGVASVGIHAASRIYMPTALDYAARRFGDLGVAFTYIGWLFGVAFALIITAVLGSVLAREPGPVAGFLHVGRSHAGASGAPAPAEDSARDEP
jgi:membrane protein